LKSNQELSKASENNFIELVSEHSLEQKEDLIFPKNPFYLLFFSKKHEA
tara:strand:- start:274 stop:420 length:147 start_codon:yes stop_codon:yes gene_type:complete